MKATETTILNFIGGFDKVFIIPPFQRNYEWGVEQCSELFYDIINAHKTNKPHYLGNVVYYVGKNNGVSYNEYILVDGQQRITSVLLLLCALRDLISEQSTVDSVNKRYLINDTSDNRFRVRLKQTSYDSKTFMSIIDKTPVENEENNIINSYNKFKELIQASNVEPMELYQSIPKLEIVEVNLQIEDDLAAIQTVFEKINSTGTPLTASDLIRNFLLLANTATEQERLYEDYWVKIEQTLSNAYISRFAHDYLVMKTFDDVPQKQVYKIFKEHFPQKSTVNIDILKDMYKYSKFFGWLKFANCPNEEINKQIKTLNFLKTEDLYPLYIYLLAELFDSNIVELKRIYQLLSDFMLRYRVVSPSGGGGALRNTVHQLLEGFSSGIIQLTYDDILFELSNSATPSGRFPHDDEFKKILMDSVNTNYARVILLKIEEHESKNIPIALDKVTIEHLMPQTLSAWWKDNFGGEEESDRIYETYINCIGNLTPISQGYNSAVSNNPWSKKIESLKDVQFMVTSQIANNVDWKERDIQLRNENLSTRACEATTSPLTRERKFQTKNLASEFEGGHYPASDISTSMKGIRPNAIIFGDEIIKIASWRDFLCKICEKVHSLDEALFKKIVEDNTLHKATSTRNYPDKDPIITKDEQKLVTAKPIGDTGYFSEGAIGSLRARIYAKKILDIYGLTEKISVSIGNYY